MADGHKAIRGQGQRLIPRPLGLLLSSGIHRHRWREQRRCEVQRWVWWSNRKKCWHRRSRQFEAGAQKAPHVNGAGLKLEITSPLGFQPGVHDDSRMTSLRCVAAGLPATRLCLRNGVYAGELTISQRLPHPLLIEAEPVGG